jgi:diguanylate cyclase (GGDEF)-like protein
LSPTAHRSEALLSLEQEDLRGVSRTIAAIHALLLILVVLHLALGGARNGVGPAVAAGLVAYAVAAIALRYAGMTRRETRWKIALETWCMTGLITWVLAHAGGLTSPLLNTYLLPVVTAALALGRLTALAQVVLVAACEIYLKGASLGVLVSLPFTGELATRLAPVVLIAYVTSLFSSDIRFGLNRTRLLSETDPLTGIYNPRGFAIVASRAFAQARRHGRPTSVLMIDCDNLAALVAGHGREIGKELLRRLGEIVLGELRYTDIAARYEDDAFVVLLAETPVRGALTVAERIRASASAGLLDIDAVRASSTVSIGLASCPEDGGTLDALVASAGRALRSAQAQGRNRVARPESSAEAAAEAEVPVPILTDAASPPPA